MLTQVKSQIEKICNTDYSTSNGEGLKSVDCMDLSYMIEFVEERLLEESEAQDEIKSDVQTLHNARIDDDDESLKGHIIAVEKHFNLK